MPQQKRNQPDSASSDPVDTPDSKKRKVDENQTDSSEKEKEVKTEAKASEAEKKAQPEEEEKECCICLETIKLPITLPCKHVFCYLCLKDVRVEQADCEDDSDDENQDESENEDQEYFRCPYCRRKTKATYVDKSKMNYNDWLKTMVKSTASPSGDTTSTNAGTNDSKDKPSEVVTWQYSGRKGGWWAYEPRNNELIEQKYQEFVSKFPNGLTSAAGVSDSDSDDDSKKKKKKKNANASDGGDDNANKVWACPIEVGHSEYMIDFRKMSQVSKEDKTKKRNVRRFTVDPTQSTLKKGDWKGCAGQFF
ncbi:hypothetical protein RFI_04519 [Reticulomyxa filosa]|uniref:RING-type domain-containing protein n=1 Tax=Reticulomyxa filosa TaxID=46433 RepID=X6P4T5_RETFI|nr:hypothetical protein RFI_04519 [Reticulomyxa filosa]|eukprot:ETO32597.1 hypothetical protein RFI_04519 [Reticulomyxa filosa]